MPSLGRSTATSTTRLPASSATLAQQYDRPRWRLIVQANPACGRVTLHDVLAHKQGGIGRTTTTTTNTSTNSTTGGATPTEGATMAPTTATVVDDPHHSDPGYVADGGGAEANPFGFLTEGPAADPTSPTTTTTTTVGKKKPNLGRFLKTVAQSSSAALERGMHQLAVKASTTTGEHAPVDQVWLGAYDAQTNQWIGATEPVALHSVQTSSSSSGGGSGDGTHNTQTQKPLTFAIPIVIVPGRTPHITLQLWIRSGAALASKSHYLLATSRVPLVASDWPQLHQRAASASHPQSPPPLVLTVPLQGPLLVGAECVCTVLPDRKCTTPVQRGWLLPDPDATTAYSRPSTLFHLPLDQTYAFPMVSTTTNSAAHSSSSTWICATERTVESAVVLPVAAAVAQLAASAAHVSQQRWHATTQHCWTSRHDSVPQNPGPNGGTATVHSTATTSATEYADVSVRVSHLQANKAGAWRLESATAAAGKSSGGGAPTIRAAFQRPNSIFEIDVLDECKLPLHRMAAGSFRQDVTCRFYPTPVRHGILPALQHQQYPPGTPRLGNLRLHIAVPPGVAAPVKIENPFDTTASSNATDTTGGDGGAEVWECVIPLEGPENHAMRECVVYNQSGQPMGSLSLSLTVTWHAGAPAATLPPASSSSQGLCAFVGLPKVVDGVLPSLDFDDGAAHSMADVPQDQALRRSQLATMGNFFTHAYLDQHGQRVRQADVQALEERAAAYRTAIQAAMGVNSADYPLPATADQVRTPHPFRPSSSRTTSILSGIGFNVHTASFSLDVMGDGAATAPAAGALFHNTTCGAPADHARGFGNIFADFKQQDNKDKAKNPLAAPLTSPVGPVSGGLRGLEASRVALAMEVSNQQNILIMQVANYFLEQRSRAKQHEQPDGVAGAPVRTPTHVPANDAGLQSTRWSVFEAIQCLHHVTWHCAVRRASAFSQALGIAVSSFLASVSDPAKLQSTWPSLWAQHGFLVSYEGLLSAAGKELGMIQDASVGIDMLRMVRIVLVPDDGALATVATRVPVPHSQYLKWIDLSAGPPTVPGHETEYKLQIAMEPSYFEQRIPAALKSAAGVRLYPLLFEVGVDIFQAASNVSSNMGKNMTATSNCEPSDSAEVLSDDGEDLGGLAYHDDELVSLNYEAFQKMNAYAQLVSPAPPVQATPSHQAHPLTATLFQHIASSSGKVNHDILDEAATLAQQLGGGGVVFCKSGKDRTAMHVTYKQSQFMSRFRQKMLPPSTDDDESAKVDSTLSDAMLIRLYGTRLPICEKNVGQAKYAFNSLQVKFMPEALKPPMSALAGFLKGGKVFGGKGIES